ncbi:FAD-binding domain-containing protein [Delitschia confertaspora ATCC 74209]|uniref:FAD-binding domain-containing protein n=1 Tax=Delitschia confertaspora ATCC 74209 TaxID=1513339 RepID=A0A9P4MUU8_9PLEO|nr:FAD-binding domain-containing protein [Delitschia confertaspora ATCC 74209]
MAGQSALWSLLALSFLPASSAVNPLNPRVEPGPAACLNLTSSLGKDKVKTSTLNIEVIKSRAGYWSTRQGAYEPSCVVLPESAQDVSTALKTIKSSGSRFAVKAGGHNPNNFFSSVDKGVLIDLRSMTEKSYDAATQLATYEPGNRFGDLYKFYADFGRTVVGARLGGVGSGLALGGGLSYLSSQYGMACDSFRELEIVTPSGDIVKASAKENPDLFFASRGGGGNAYGVVTKYTVQSRPAGTFYAGNVIFLFEQTDKVLNAIRDFTQYNTDPKAAIIGTYEKLPTPSLELNLDEAIILFLVYDGEDPGDAFKNFTSIPHVLNTMAKKTYTQVTELPLPGSTEITKADNSFRVAVHSIGDGSIFNKALEAWRDWAEANKGSYLLSSIDFQPIPKSLTDASNAYEGGNAMQMPDGPWFWINYLITTPYGMSEDKYNAVQKEFKRMVESVPSDPSLPLFINDAAKDQEAVKSFSTFERLREIKKKWDPENFFAEKTGGWSFE